jgi:hypothetical protein
MEIKNLSSIDISTILIRIAQFLKSPESHRASSIKFHDCIIKILNGVYTVRDLES